jgi:hypothetical protein
MPTVDEREDEIIQTAMPAALERRAHKVFDDAPFTTSILQSLEAWLRANDDDKAARIVEKAALQMATHEAETT